MHRVLSHAHNLAVDSCAGNPLCPKYLTCGLKPQTGSGDPPQKPVTSTKRHGFASTPTNPKTIPPNTSKLPLLQRYKPTRRPSLSPGPFLSTITNRNFLRFFLHKVVFRQSFGILTRVFKRRLQCVSGECGLCNSPRSMARVSGL